MISAYGQERSGTPEELELSETKPYPILLLPAELALPIFLFLSLTDICHFELTCRRFRDKIKELHVYYEWYGPAIPHQCVNAETDWKRMSLDMERYFDSRQTPKNAIRTILDEKYLCDDEVLAEQSKLVIMSLRRSKEHTAEWYEVMAAACMALKRPDEAEKLYESILQITGGLPTSAFLTKARFGWPSTLPPPDNVTQETKENALFGAAVAGNLNMIRQLHSEGVSLETVVNNYSLSTLAAELGNLFILQYLCEEGIDVLRRLPSGNTALMEATESDQSEVIQWLLDRGADPFPPHNYCPFHVPLRQGNLELLRIFLRHISGPLRPDKTNGELVIEEVLMSTLNLDKRHELIKCLVTEGGMDIHARDEHGRNAAHIATVHGDLQSAKLLRTLGVNISVKDDFGRTPLDTAIQFGRVDVSSWLFQNTTGESQYVTALERALAMNRITYPHGWPVRRTTSTSLDAYFTRTFYDGKAMMRMLAETDMWLFGDRAREALVTESTDTRSDWKFFAPRCPRRRQHFMKFMESIGVMWKTWFDDFAGSFRYDWRSTLSRANEGILRGEGLVRGVRQRVTMLYSNEASVYDAGESPFRRSIQASECFVGGFGVAYLYGRLNTAGSIRTWLNYIRGNESSAYAELKSYFHGGHMIVRVNHPRELVTYDIDTLMETPNTLGWPSSIWETARNVSSFWRWTGSSEISNHTSCSNGVLARAEYNSFRRQLSPQDVDHQYLKLHGLTL